MKSKVMLFDAEGTQVGETFMRRARQLVNQQRAEWISESAIRFAPDAEIEESEWKGSEEVAAVRPSKFGEEALLYHLAEERLRKRRNFKIHSILFLPGAIIVALFADLMRRNTGADGFLIGSWVTPYLIHAFFYMQTWLDNRKPERHEKQLALEVSRLRKAMG